MFSPLSVLLPILFHASFHVAALHFSINGKPTYSQFYKRDHISGLDNALNLNYFTNITLGEQQFSVSIDTGRQAIFCFCFCFLTSELQLLTSSDLWVAGNIVNSNDTGVSTGVQYAVGNVYGNVRTAPLTFLNFSVPGQAFSMFQNCRCPFCADMHPSPGQFLFYIPSRSGPHWPWSECRLKRP
jgi:hypothetical protein